MKFYGRLRCSDIIIKQHSAHSFLFFKEIKFAYPKVDLSVYNKIKLFSLIFDKRTD